jgi:peptidoglycan/LPS O-acetylase OafA/YrhL
MQFLTAIAAMLGTWVGTMMATNNKLMQDLLIAATSGGFVYIATIGAMATVINTRRRVGLGQTLLEILLIAAGIGLMILVAMSEQHSHDHSHSHGTSRVEVLGSAAGDALGHVHTLLHDDHHHHHHDMMYHHHDHR